jgi:hypothetical protein
LTSKDPSMKFRTHLFCAAVLAAAASAAGAADVGVSVQISQPGVYGRIDIGRFPQPQVIVPQPVIVAAPPVVVAQPAQPAQPVYVWVPPGHRKNWSKHCHEYNACGVPVYFVRHDWYRDHVMVAANEGQVEHEHEHGNGKSHGKGHGG